MKEKKSNEIFQDDCVFYNVEWKCKEVLPGSKKITENLVLGLRII